jgi:hypothetical protein
MRIASESNQELLPYVQKHYIHSELISNAAILQSILYVYDKSIVWEIKNLNNKILLHAFSPLTHDKW